MYTYSIVSADNVDWFSYRDFRLEALQTEPQAFGSSYNDQVNRKNEEWQHNLKRYIQGNGNWMFFATQGLNLIGMMGAFQTDADRKNNTAQIIAVYVKREFRGKGVGKKLMKALLEELAKAKIKKVKLSVNVEQVAAVKLYENFGFKVVSKEDQILGDGQKHTEYNMEFELL
jgi:ribosomal protein S18 acetylase RimI-like enzyme